MKKIYYMIAMAFMAITFTSCENVPDPYGKPVSPIIPYEPAGTGVETDPFNVAGAIEKCKEIGGKASTEIYYIKGYAAENASADGGKIQFTMTDSKEGKGKKYTAYKVAGSDNKSLPSDFAISIGEEIVLYGPMYYYNSKTPETANGAYIITVNGEKTGSNTPGGDTDKGTEDKPFDVASAIAAGDMTGVYLKGYIVGSAYYNGDTQKNEFNFGTTNAQASNLLLAATPTETDYTKCMPIALPSSTAIRTALNIKDNAGNVGKEVLLYGNLTKYFGQPGMKETSYAVLDGTAIGTKPGGGTEPPSSNLEAGQYFFIIQVNGTYKEGIPVASDKDYGYITLEDATITEGKLAGKEAHIFTFTKEGDGFTIQDASNRYYYMDDSHSSFQVAAAKPTSNHIWAVNVGSDGKATITNIGRNKVVDYSTQYNNFSPGDNGGGYPMLLKQGAALDGGTSGGGDTGGGDTGGGDTGGGDAGSGDITAAASSFGFENQGVATTATLTDGTTLAFDKGEGSNDPKYYSGDYASIRMYAKNLVTITSSKAITKIVITTTAGSGSTKYNGNDTAFAEGGDTKVNIKKNSDTEIEFSGLNSKTVKIVNEHTAATGGTQLRLATISITYAK